MADDEAALEPSCGRGHPAATVGTLKRHLEELRAALAEHGGGSPVQASSRYCQDFCRTLLEYAGCWKVEEDPLPLVEVYTVALLSYGQASEFLSQQCDNVPLVLERLSLSFIELLLSLKQEIPDGLWAELKSSVRSTHCRLQEISITQLDLLASLTQQSGVWTNSVLRALLSDQELPTEQVEEFLALEGPVLLEMRVKQLIKDGRPGKAALLAKICSEHPAFEGKGHFKQMRLVCLCTSLEQDQLMEELSKVDCRDALEMICNLESEGDEGAAFSLCSAFLTRQLLQGDTYCAWELTLFWSKLLKRLESSEQAFLDRCRQMSLLSKTVFHILFLIKVIQSEIATSGLPVCVEMCIRALQMESNDGNTKATICKTISCLLPTDLEVKRACQLTQFLLEPTVDAYYAVGTLYNEPDQKLDEQNMPVPNSLRCELLLVFKTQWPFDPEFWDWHTLKRHCLALMGEEASIVSSIDLLNDNESPVASGDEEEDTPGQESFRDVMAHFMDATNELRDITDKRQKNKEIKKLREKGFVSARFRNWQAYMQYCVLCDKEFLGHRIVRHAQTHFKDGLYNCPICVETFTSKDTLVPHVASHVKQSCKERLTAMKSSKKLANLKMGAPVIAALSAQTENQHHTAFGDSQGHSSGLTHTVQANSKLFHTEGGEGHICPVSSCRKGFKFSKNLLVHVRAHRDNEEATRYLEMHSNKVVCQYCRRHFVNVTHLNDHLQVHCGAKPYICIQLNCKASFLSNTELLVHRKEHSVFKARCMFPNCGNIFHEAFKLYDHEAQHYKTFTCKVADCGKIFHSQSQLDVHQGEHAAREVQCPVTEHQNSELGPSLIERMLSNPTPFAQQISQESKDLSSESHLLHDCRMVANSTERLLMTSQDPAQDFGQYSVNSELHDDTLPTVCQTQVSETSVIRSSANSHFSDPNGIVDVNSFDHLRAALLNQPMPHFDATAGNQSNAGHATQGQTQMFSNRNVRSVMYNPNCNVQFPQQSHSGPICATNISVAGPVQNNVPTTIAQPFPASVTPLTPSGIRQVNSVLYPVGSTPSAEQKERHYCAFETCTRNYGSYRSVNKHMKETHPEFYEKWKQAKRSGFLSAGPSRRGLPVGNPNLAPPRQIQPSNAAPMHGVQRQNVIQPPSFPNVAPTSCYTTPPSHLASVQNQNFPTTMENLLNPIVLSQLGSVANSVMTVHNQVATAPPQWDLTSGNGQISNCASSQVYPSNMQGVSQMDSTGGALTVGIPLQPVLMENESQSALPSYIDTSNTPSHQMAKTLQPLTFQSLNNSASNPMPPDMTMQKPVIQSDFPFPNVAGQASINAPSQNGMVNPGNVPVKQKKTRRHTRAKWPAIVRDGKFLCCRCFREFNSPKSLGGHLSKRSHCKPFGEEELVADLPASFLDLLNSEPTMNNIQLQPSAVYQERPCTTQSVTRGLTDSKDFHASNYPQANLPAFTNEETHDDILKQIMADANMADLFEQPAVPQPLYHSPYEIVEAFPEISVIQHTGHVKAEKTEGELYTSPYPQSSVDPFASSNFQDPILSQVMSENLQGSPRPSHSAVPVPSGGILNECPTSSMTRQTTDVISNPVKQTLSPDPHHSPVSRSGKHGEMERKSAEETVKKRLREQILAGDFQHRNSLSHASTDANVCLKRPLSSVSNISVSKHSELNRVPQEAKTDTACGGQVEQLTHTTPSAFPGEFPRSVCTESFSGFREASSPQDDLLIPVIKAENEIDAAPTQLPPNQPQWVMEIQSALERLDLVKEMSSENALSSMKQSGITIQGENESVKVKSPMADTFPIFEKPFSCESDNCTFKAMSCEPLWKHLIKSHNYTLEMVNSFRQRQGNFARFCCQKCNKSFTRNSNLRAHYQSAHKLSPEEIADLNLKHKLYRATGHLNNQNNQMSGNMTQVAQTTAGSHITGKGTHQDVMTQNYPPQPFVQIGHMGVTNQRLHDDNHTTPIPPLQSGPMHNMQQSLSAGAQASTLAAQPLQTLPAAKWSDGRLGSVQTTPTQYLAVPQAGANLSTVPAALTLPPSAPIKAAVPQLLDQQTNLNKQHFACPNIERLNMEIAKKAKEKKPDSSSVFSPYRPYRCVHQGCLAAFTIQHNLILHYRAVHQSALSALEVSKEQDQSERAEASNDPEEEEEEEEEEEDDDEEAECEFIKVSEFRCQEKDCSRVFLEVPSLLQHYLHLHKFSLDRAGALLCSINLGRFSCDQPSCGASFTAFWKYIGHVKEVHSNSVLAKPEQVNGMFKCDIEDCDRAYATKSNLLRHTMKKHQEMYQLKLMNKKITEDAVKQNSKTPHYQLAKASNGKENIESNKKLTQKGVDKKRGDLSNNLHWTKYGKPSLKTKEEALAMCTKKFPLQYPCMIKGCEYVTKSERNIMKHYIGHGLSEKYLEEHRSNLLFCKKFSRYRYWSNRSDDSKSENTSDLSDSEDPEDAVLEGSDYRHSKPILRKRPASNDESFEGGSNVPVKRKRGRPRKLADTQVKRKSIPRSSTRNRVVYHADDDSDSSSGVAAATTPTWETKEPNAPLASFKPMGFEMSFLKFLEQKDLSKSSAGAHVSLRRKSPKDTCVSFSNRQNLESLRKVRILVDGSYSFVTELLLKQLQDMKPVVILEKND